MLTMGFAAIGDMVADTTWGLPAMLIAPPDDTGRVVTVRGLPPKTHSVLYMKQLI